MNEDQSVQDTLKKVRQGQGRKIAYLIIAVVAVAVIIGVFINGTRGTDVSRSSAAMSEPVPQNQVAQDAGTVPVQ